MLGFMLNKEINNTLLRAYQAEINEYKEDMNYYLSQPESNSFSNDQWKTIYSNCADEYLNRVMDRLVGILRGMDSSAEMRWKLAMGSPALAGVPDGAIDMVPLPAGVVYCLFYYAVTGKKAKYKYATQHNHIFHDYIDSALKELAEE